MIGPSLSRRAVLAAAGAAGMTIAFPRFPSASPGGAVSHGLSVFGELKYPPDFTHFEYANPNAPKGGRYVSVAPSYAFNQNVQTFNTLNTFVARGDAPPRMELCYDSLMTRAIDEPDAVYGLIARTVTVSADHNSFTFELRPEAQFHDGTPVTAEDVAFSYSIFKEKGHPGLLLPLREMVTAEAIDPRTFRLVFSGRQSLLAILVAAVLGGMGLGLEIAQSFVPGRVGSAADAVMNVLGVALGWGLGRRVRHRLPQD